MAQYTTVTLSTPQLEVGMIVQAHGARFRLTACTHTAEDAANTLKFNNVRDLSETARVSTLRAFSTELLGNVHDEHPHSIPATFLYRDGDGNAWSIQGNHNAFWRVELEAVPANTNHLVANHTAFRDFSSLLWAEGGYRPSLDVSEPVMLQIADAYDAAQAARGDARRAYRYGGA